MSTSLAPYIAPFASFITVTLLVLSLFAPRKSQARDKIRAYTSRSAQETDNLNRPFSERVVFPLFERFGRVLGATAPKQMQERLQETVDQAGNPISVNVFLVIRTVGMIGLPLAYLGVLLPTHASFTTMRAGLLILLGFGGMYFPKMWLERKARARQKAIERALPDALDLIVVSMEAGLALDGAIAKVVEKSRGPLKDELQKMLQEIALGKPRRDALRQMAARSKVSDLIALINSVVQADQMGVSVAQVMRTQADEARIKRRQRAEEKAHQAAVKMLFPLIMFILPSVMVVTVGPAAITIYRQLSKGLLG